jgi:hypothetical protein
VKIGGCASVDRVMSSSPVPTITPAVARLLRDLLAKPTEWFNIFPGKGTRIANIASGLGLVKQRLRNAPSTIVSYSGDEMQAILGPATAALRKYDQGTLPQGTNISTADIITHDDNRIGHLRRSGAGRGAPVVWSAVHEDGAIETNVGDFRGDRIAAARAVCKHAGIELPGE